LQDKVKNNIKKQQLFFYALTVPNL